VLPLARFGLVVAPVTALDLTITLASPVAGHAAAIMCAMAALRIRSVMSYSLMSARRTVSARSRAVCTRR
jgi:hypothetical protein